MPRRLVDNQNAIHKEHSVIKCSSMQSRRGKRKGAAEESQLSPEQIWQRTFQSAIRLLAAKPRSIAELREGLLRGRSASKPAVEAAISRLKEYGYLDDERFAFGYAALKVQQKPVGRKRLKRDLELKRIDRAVADEALDLVFGETSEEELIDRAMEKRIRLRGRPKNRAEAKSLFDHLLRQGFPYELVAEKVRAASTTELEQME
jgi:regulatory protein